MKKTSTGLITFVVVLLAIGGLVQLIFTFVFLGKASELESYANSLRVSDFGGIEALRDSVKESVLSSARSLRQSAYICLVSSIITFLTACAFGEIVRNFKLLCENDEVLKTEISNEINKETYKIVRREINESLSDKSHEDTEELFRIGLNYFKSSNESERGKSFTYFEMAAFKGHAKAMYNLAACYINGYGAEKSIPKALVWLEKADNHGVMQAKELIDKIHSGQIS